MSTRFIDIFPMTFIASATIKRHRLMTASGAHATADSKEVVGASRTSGNAKQEILVGIIGVYTCTAGAAIAVGDPVKCGAEGRVVKGSRATAADDLLVVGTAIEAATKIEDEFQVLFK